MGAIPQLYLYGLVRCKNSEFGILTHITTFPFKKLSLTRPLYLTCDILNARYTKLVKMETFDHDIRYYIWPTHRLSVTSLSKILSFRGYGWVPISNLNSHRHQSPLNVTNIFKDVPKSLLSSIIEKFTIDFEVCGYQETLKEMKHEHSMRKL